MAFKMKRGSSPLYKDLGSSPVHHPHKSKLAEMSHSHQAKKKMTKTVTGPPTEKMMKTFTRILPISKTLTQTLIKGEPKKKQSSYWDKKLTKFTEKRKKLKEEGKFYEEGTRTRTKKGKRLQKKITKRIKKGTEGKLLHQKIKKLLGK